MKNKTYNKNEIRKILENNGYRLARSSGGHKIYKNENETKTIVITRQTNKMVFRRLIKEHGLKEVV